ncbi:hypothetical protein ACWEOW_02330 [Monashia sp. NPDC004114]
MKQTRMLSGIAALAILAFGTADASPASASEHRASSAQGRTTVVLNPALVPTLVDTLHVRTLAPGRLSAPGGVAQVSFPITRVGDGVVRHVGGLRFVPVGGGDLRITAFNIDLGTGYLNARTKLNGERIPGRVNIFALGSVQPINGTTPSCDGIAAGLTLTPDAAGALGAPAFAGAFVGDACVRPASHGEDSDG